MDKIKILSKAICLMFVVLFLVNVVGCKGNCENVGYATNLKLSDNIIQVTTTKAYDIIKSNLNKTKIVKKKKVVKKKKKNKMKYLGVFKVYAYCACQKCCGKNAHGVTSTGTKVKEGRTIAVDPKVIPLGSTVYIKYKGKTHKYIAEDTGGGWIQGFKIDKYMKSHSACNKWGIKNCKVYVVKKKHKK